MIPYHIKYENHQGESLWLDDTRYFVNINDLRNFTWEYSINNRPSGFGGRGNKIHQRSNRAQPAHRRAGKQRS